MQINYKNIIILLAFIVFSLKLNAARDFSERQAINLTGDFKAIGNTSIVCTTNCGSPNVSNNPPAVMGYVNVDADGTNFNSSRSELILPAGATIEWAGLYWTAVSQTSGWGLTPPVNAAAENQVRLRSPTGGYTTITATQFDTTIDTPSAGWRTYMAFAEVTSQVQAGGVGDYYIGNIQSDRGSAFTGPNAGWNLIVIYKAAGESFKRINVWDGWKFFGFGAFENFTITGLLTPNGGTVEAKAGIWAMDGELNQTGDSNTLNGTALSDALNPSNNFANGTLGDLGSNVSTRSPNLPYNWGVDLDTYDATGILPNNATSVAVSLGSSSEGIWSGVYALSTRLVIPTIDKTFNPTTIFEGQTSRVTITIDNPVEGLSITNTNLTDTFPAGMVVAGTPDVINTCGGTVTAVATMDSVSLTAGTVPPGSSCSFSVLVTTNVFGTFDNTIPKEDLDNAQGVDAQEDATASLIVMPIADISVSKSDTSTIYTPGQTLTYNIVVTNDGPSSISGVSVSDVLPSGLTLSAAWTCTVTNPGSGAIATSCPASGGAIGDASVSLSANLANNGVVTISVPVTYSTDSSDY